MAFLGKIQLFRAEALKKVGQGQAAAEEERRAFELLKAAGMLK